MQGLALRAGVIGCAAACLLALAPVASVHAQAKPATGGARATGTDDEEARTLFQLGKQAFDEARFERALKYFQDSYDLSHRPELLYNIGAVLDRLRRDREAVAAYREYLDKVPAAYNRNVVEERIRIIEGVQQQPAPAATPAPAPTPEQTAQAAAPAPAPAPATAPAAATAPSDSESRPVTSSPWFWAGVGGAVAAVVVIGIVAGSSTTTKTQEPAVLGSNTRVREL